MSGGVFLGGGGSEQQEAALWDEAFPAGSTVAIWPFAHREPSGRTSSVEWMTSALRARGYVAIDAWMIAEIGAKTLDGVDIIAIPGGNTFDLLHELRVSGLLPLLREHLRDGGGYYGGSAGAILAGLDIAIASVADPNTTTLNDTRGLDLAGGTDILPHYAASQRGWAQEFSAATGRPLLCLPESSGLVITGAEARNVGPEPIELVTATSIRIIPAGEARPLLRTPAR